MNTLTPEEIAEMDAFNAGVDETLKVACEWIAYNEEYRREVAAREAQESLNAEHIAVIEGRESAA